MKHLQIHTPQYINYLKEFSSYIQAMGYKPKSQKSIPSCLKEFLHQLEERRIVDIRSVERKDIQIHYEYLQNRPKRYGSGALSDSVLYYHIYSLRSFFTFLQETDQLNCNPISTFRLRAKSTPPRAILTTAEIDQLYTATESLRERALLSVYYGCGLRCAEGVALNTKDIDYKEQLLYVRLGKGAKRRVVPMNKRVTADLEGYFRYERAQYIHAAPLYYRGKFRDTPDNQNAFFIGNTGRRSTKQLPGQLLKAMLGHTAIKKTISLHNLRHSIATHLLESGMSLEYVQAFLGHRQLVSTQTYIRHARSRYGKW